MTSPDYDTDLYAWSQAQAEALRAKDWGALDVANLAEEIESVGREQAHAVESYLAGLCLHLLKWRYQPARRGKSWQLSMQVARQRIARRLRDSPSLRPRLPGLLADAYADARRLAATQTDLPLATFPEACPWPLAQVLDEDFLPEVG
jgi:hypothetical protein